MGMYGGIVLAQGIEFPDQQFEAFVLAEYDQNGDGLLTIDEAGLVTHMDCSGQNIRDLTGLEYFAELVSFTSNGNPLEIFPRLELARLANITIAQSRLQRMPDFSGLVALNRMRISYSLIWEMPDLSMLTNMDHLDLHGNLIMFTPNIPVGLSSFYLTDNLMFRLDHQDKLQPIGTDFWVWYNFLDEDACPIVANTAGTVQGSPYTFMRGFLAFPYNEERFAHMIRVSNRGLGEYNINCNPE